MLSYDQEKKLEVILSLIQVPEDQVVLSREFNDRERNEKGRFISKEAEESESNFNDKDYKWVKTGSNTWELVPRFTIGDVLALSTVGLVIVSVLTWL